MSESTMYGWKRWHIWLFALFVFILAYLTYFHRYWDPPHVFWDENYHIASAQKYLHGIYFMEQHPPLGKLLVAAGEKMFGPNAVTDQFLDTDYGTQFEGFSFAGYRFFSALLSWWTAPILFAILLLLIRNPLWSALLSFFYVFDNALIVHLRGAMLEGPLMFFTALTVLFSLLALRDRMKMERLALWGALLGVSFALALATKVLGLILILLLLPVLWKIMPHWKRALAFLGCFALPFLFVYCTVWEIHFALGRTVNPALPDAGYYQASEEYKTVLDTGRMGSLASFPVMLRDSWHFVSHYNGGAPRLDLCKEDENGSPVYFWPFGGRTINYRWETPEGERYSYLYLVPNPAVWWFAFAGLLLGCGLLASSVLCPPKKALKHRFLMGSLVAMYFSYMFVVSRIDRVLYLYHYFIPLFLTFIITALVFDELQTMGKKALHEHGKTAIALTLAALIFIGHQFYRPFSYYLPLTDAQFARRNIFNLWDLRCVNCPNENGLVIPQGKFEQ